MESDFRPIKCSLSSPNRPAIATIDDTEQIEPFDAAGNEGGAYLIVGKCTVADGAISFTACARNASQSPAALFLHWPVVESRISIVRRLGLLKIET